jgi:hypothetical protein
LDESSALHITHFLLDIRTIRCGLHWPSQVDQCELVSSNPNAATPTATLRSIGAAHAWQ